MPYQERRRSYLNKDYYTTWNFVSSVIAVISAFSCLIVKKRNISQRFQNNDTDLTIIENYLNESYEKFKKKMLDILNNKIDLKSSNNNRTDALKSFIRNILDKNKQIENEYNEIVDIYKNEMKEIEKKSRNLGKSIREGVDNEIKKNEDKLVNLLENISEKYSVPLLEKSIELLEGNYLELIVLLEIEIINIEELLSVELKNIKENLTI